MAGNRKKKQHICAECGEAFNHGIGLRKHQRQTGHKGSQIEDEGDAAPPAAAPPPQATPPTPAAPPPPAVAPPVAPPPVEVQRAPEVVAAPVVEPIPQAVVQQEQVYEDDDQTVAVQRPSLGHSYHQESVPVHHDPYETYEQRSGPTKMEDRKQKLNLVSSGLKVVISAKAKNASKQLKVSARSGADIFTEALKLAVALVCFLLIPTIIFFWWKSYKQGHPDTNQTQLFTIENPEVAARSTLLKYLDHLKKEEWDQAYSLLSPSWQSELDLPSFQDAFLDIEDVRWAVSDPTLNPEGGADVMLRLTYREGGRPKAFIGRFRLHNGSQGWRIDRAELSTDGTS